MFTRKTLTSHMDGFLADIKAAGYSPPCVVLFGSYAYGNPHEHRHIAPSTTFTRHRESEHTILFYHRFPIVRRESFIQIFSFPQVGWVGIVQELFQQGGGYHKSFIGRNIMK